MCKKAPEAPKPGSAPCHACLLLADERRDLNARSSWRRICDDCADKFVNKPLPVPVERVRICPDTLGVWGQSREIYQSWDTGLGTVVPARKYNLSPVPDGKVAIVLQDAADAATVDRLIGPQSVKPDRTFLLRYCSSIKSFCADQCFGSPRDKSCMTHIKQRMRPADQKCMVRPQQKRPMADFEPPTKREPQNLQNPYDAAFSDASWLLDEIAALGESNDVDMGLRTWAADDSTAMLAACLQPGTASSSSSDTSSSATPPDSPPSDDPVRLGAPSSWNGEKDPDNILNSLSSLLGEDDHAVNDSWTPSAVDVLGDALDGPLSAFPLGPYPPHLRAKPKMGARPAQFMKGVNVPISKQHVWAKGPPGASQRIGKPALSTTKGSTPKNGPTQRTKCVWKQQVTW